jgi:hypothetical protein
VPCGAGSTRGCNSFVPSCKSSRTERALRRWRGAMTEPTHESDESAPSWEPAPSREAAELQPLFEALRADEAPPPMDRMRRRFRELLRSSSASPTGSAGLVRWAPRTRSRGPVASSARRRSALCPPCHRSHPGTRPEPAAAGLRAGRCDWGSVLRADGGWLAPCSATAPRVRNGPAGRRARLRASPALRGAH